MAHHSSTFYNANNLAQRHKSERNHVMHVDSSSNSIRMKRHIDYRIYNQYDMRVIEEA